jgi:hypothetical protein
MSRVDFDRRVCSPSGADEPAAWGSKGYGITLPSLWCLLRRMSFRRSALLERPAEPLAFLCRGFLAADHQFLAVRVHGRLTDGTSVAAPEARWLGSLGLGGR